MKICPECDFQEFIVTLNGVVFELIVEPDFEQSELIFTNKVRINPDNAYAVKYKCKNCGYTEYDESVEGLEVEEEEEDF